MSKSKFFYSIWAVINTVLFYLSGYPTKFAINLSELPFVSKPWSSFLDHSNKLFLIHSKEFYTYDITEYTLAMLVPLFISYMLKSAKPKKLRYQKPPNIY